MWCTRKSLAIDLALSPASSRCARAGRGPNAPPRPPEIRGWRSESRGVPTPALRRSAVHDSSDAAERAGVNPAASLHWLRHAHASHAIDNGAPITLVSATLGYADLKTTSVYAHARFGESSGRYLKTK